MKKIIVIILIQICTINLKAQSKVRFPVWTFHDDSTTVNGLSVGLNVGLKTDHVKVNGVNFELLGFGLLTPLIPHSPLLGDSLASTEKICGPKTLEINGLNISPSGMICDCNINGLNINGMGSIVTKTNGLTLAYFGNFAEASNGVQLACIGNAASYMNGLQLAFIGNIAELKSTGVQISGVNHAAVHKGVQIGLVNKSEIIKGIQIGLWNKNQKRSLPFINWAFKS